MSLPPGLERLNALDADEARSEFLRCCGSARWAGAMASRRPFRDAGDLFDCARKIERGLSREDWIEAFRHHPRIGDKEALRLKFASTRAWAAGEQGGAALASEKTLEDLARANGEYEKRFGYIFIICATGKSAEEMLQALRSRLSNAPDAELGAAAAEQSKITRLRLEKLLHNS
jgi:2-oxo-4-hydroxy-4-carboxy-5-ureidoimidazoline decarboxylase